MRNLILSSALIASFPSLANSSCMPVSAAKKIAADTHGAMTSMSPAQWQFLRGAFAFDPGTPNRVPYGDRAAIITSSERETALVFFLDGDKACDPIIIGKGSVAILMNLGAIVHAPKIEPSAPVPAPPKEPSPKDNERMKL